MSKSPTGLEKISPYLAVLFLGAALLLFFLWNNRKSEIKNYQGTVKVLQDSVAYWKEMATPPFPAVDAYPIDRGHANTWISDYVAAHPNSLQTVIYDLRKLAGVIQHWEYLRGTGVPVNAVSAHLITYNNDISLYPYDPKKVPGAFSILLSPWDTTANGGQGAYYYNAANVKTKPINLGDLRP
jgi:hypothetical protein